MNIKSFDSYQFHDNLVHGISFMVENFKSELHLDIDHILQWPKCSSEKNKELLFSVARHTVRFHDVTDLSINIGWGDSGYTTAISGICIDMIDRVSIPTTLRLPTYYKWNVRMTDGNSIISFGASSVALEVTGTPVSVPRQFLLDGERTSSLIR